MKKLLYFLIPLGLLISGVAIAVNVTVPQATSVGGIPVGLSTGNYAAGFLSAGSNITISTSTTGQIQISSTGGGTPGGSTTQVQFNDGGSFGGSPNFYWNKASSTLNIGNPSAQQIADGSMFNVNGTISVNNGIDTGGASFNFYDGTFTNFFLDLFSPSANVIQFGGVTSSVASFNIGNLTTTRNFIFPDKDGMFALTSDITGGSSQSTSTIQSMFSALSPMQLSATSGLISVLQASGSQNGFLSSTDYATFNSKLTTIGSGASSTIAAWANSANTLTSSPISISGSNIGIGTSTPNGNLDLQGSATSNSGTGTISWGSAGTLTGVGTAFTSQLHLGDEIASSTNKGIINSLTSTTAGNAARFSGGTLSGSTFSFAQPILRALNNAQTSGIIVTNSGYTNIGTPSFGFAGTLTVNDVGSPYSANSGNAGTLTVQNNGSSNGSFALVVKTNGNGVSISNAGNMVIGTNGAGVSPAATLDVRGVATNNPFSVSSSSGANLLTITQAGNVGVGTTTPNATLHVYGSRAANYTVDNASAYTIATSTDFRIAFASSTIAQTVTLPNCVAGTDQVYYEFIDTSGAGATKNKTIAAAGSDTINGAASKVLNTAFAAVGVQCMRAASTSPATWFITHN